jgi:hypothetical protein
MTENPLPTPQKRKITKKKKIYFPFLCFIAVFTHFYGFINRKGLIFATIVIFNFTHHGKLLPIASIKRKEKKDI